MDTAMTEPAESPIHCASNTQTQEEHNHAPNHINTLQQDQGNSEQVLFHLSVMGWSVQAVSIGALILLPLTLPLKFILPLTFKKTSKCLHHWHYIFSNNPAKLLQTLR